MSPKATDKVAASNRGSGIVSPKPSERVAA